MKQFKRRFVASAMIAFAILLALLVGGMVLMSYQQMAKESVDFIDRMLNDRFVPFQPIPGPIFGYQPDLRSAPAGFYDLTVDEQGSIISQEMRGIYDPDALDVAETISHILQKGTAHGKVGSYMYGNKMTANGLRIILVDSAFHMQALYAMLRGAGIVCAMCLLLMFLILQPIAMRCAKANLAAQERERQFITNASHELKTPVAVIQANVEAMEIIAGDTKWSRNIHQQTQRLNHMITQLLLMEKMDEQLLKATTVPVELRALIHAAVQEVHDLFAQRGITLRMALPNELRFQGHTEALAQLLHILLDNAARYAAENTEAVLAVQQVKNTVQLTLENQVEALPDCPPEQLFERFHRGGITRKQGDMGCGIGLSAAAGIVTLHRGQITVNYPDAHSFRITVLLPCREKRATHGFLVAREQRGEGGRKNTADS